MLSACIPQSQRMRLINIACALAYQKKSAGSSRLILHRRILSSRGSSARTQLSEPSDFKESICSFRIATSSRSLIISSCNFKTVGPITTPVNKKKGQYDLMVVLTDGEAPEPKPCLVRRAWILVPGTSMYFDTPETVIKMKKEEKKNAA